MLLLCKEVLHEASNGLQHLFHIFSCGLISSSVSGLVSEVGQRRHPFLHELTLDAGLREVSIHLIELRAPGQSYALALT